VKPKVRDARLSAGRSEAVLNVPDVAANAIAENITCLPRHPGQIKCKSRGVCDRHISVLGTFGLNIVVHQSLDYHLNLLRLKLENDRKRSLIVLYNKECYHNV
jgi:hypothetical protein